jgi:hypothetical protein
LLVAGCWGRDRRKIKTPTQAELGWGTRFSDRKREKVALSRVGKCRSLGSDAKLHRALSRDDLRCVYGIARSTLAAEAVGDAVCSGSSFPPEELFQLRTFNADLPFCAGGIANPHDTGMRAIDESLKNDHIARIESMARGMEASAGRRDVERANVRSMSGRKKIHFKRDGYRKALVLAQLAK